MTSVVKPEWRRLNDLDIIKDKRTMKLSKMLDKKIAAIFLTTSNDHKDDWEMFKKRWEETFKGDKSRRLYSVAILTEKDKSLRKHNQIQEHDADNWDCSTSEIMSSEELHTWLDSIGVPKTFHEGVVSEEEELHKGLKTPSHSLNYPIILLVDPDLTIRKSLFGLQGCEGDKKQCEQIDEFIECAKRIPTGQKQPVPASPAMAGAGISADEILSFMVE